MNRLWNYISYLGLEDKRKNLSNRTIILSNQLNLVMLFMMTVLGITVFLRSKMGDGPMGLGSFRVFILFFVHILIFIFSYNKRFLLTKISLIFLPPVILFIFPFLIGFVEEESFFYYPVGIIGLSLIPHLILIPEHNRYLYIISLSFFLLLLAFLHRILVHFTPVQYDIITTIEKFRFYYVFIPIIVFLFAHMAIFYLRRLNINFEKEVLDYTQQLNITIEELKITQQHLIQSEKMASLGTLTAGVAHEINNPLNYISGGLQILEEIGEQIDSRNEDGLRERYYMAIDIIDSGVKRANGIVNSLMTFSYKGTSKLVDTDIHKLINNTLLFLRSRITRDIRIVKEFGLKRNVPLFKEKMHQVMLNILDNAIFAVKNAKENVSKTIKIETTEENELAVITITNSGPFIPDEELKQIFDPFFTTKEPGQGTGLGLSICYTLIKEHNGRIYAENRNEGVAFIIKLPLNIVPQE